MHYDIVVIGGGAGGLELAARLGRKLGRKAGRERVLLIDRQVFHLWKPTPHEVAAGTLDAHQEGLSYMILARRNHFDSPSANWSRSTRGPPAHARRPARRGRRAARAGAHDQLHPRRARLGSGSNFFGTPVRPSMPGYRVAADAERFQRPCSARSRARPFRTPASPWRSSAAAPPASNSRPSCSRPTRFCSKACVEQRFRLDITLVEAGPRLSPALPGRSRRRRSRAGAQGRARADRDAGDRDRAQRLLTKAGDARRPRRLGRGHQGGRGERAFRPRHESSQPVRRRRPPAHLGDRRVRARRLRAMPVGRPLVPRAQAAHQQASYLARVLLAALRERPIDEPGSTAISARWFRSATSAASVR